MSFLGNLSLNELSPMIQVVQKSFEIRSHRELFNWLQEEIQHFVPHNIVISAWGDFSLDIICYDIVSPIPGLRTENFSEAAILPFLTTLFDRWNHEDHLPYTVNADAGFSLPEDTAEQVKTAMQSMRSAIVHGIKDQRGRHDCLYVLFGPEALGTDKAREALRVLLPFIDTAFRQIAHLPDQYLPTPTTALSELKTPEAQADTGNGDNKLSPRELDIMEWVRAGKTNQEIGMILDISAFTVKNHLQRIFKKLDVMNRAQAVSKIDTLRQHLHLR